MDAEKEKMRQALFMAAPHHQGSSASGKAIAEALGLPFPLRLGDINKARIEAAWKLVRSNSH